MVLHILMQPNHAPVQCRITVSLLDRMDLTTVDRWGPCGPSSSDETDRALFHRPENQLIVNGYRIASPHDTTAVCTGNTYNHPGNLSAFI